MTMGLNLSAAAIWFSWRCPWPGMPHPWLCWSLVLYASWAHRQPL